MTARPNFPAPGDHGFDTDGRTACARMSGLEASNAASTASTSGGHVGRPGRHRPGRQQHHVVPCRNPREGGLKCCAPGTGVARHGSGSRVFPGRLHGIGGGHFAEPYAGDPGSVHRRKPQHRRRDRRRDGAREQHGGQHHRPGRVVPASRRPAPQVRLPRHPAVPVRCRRQRQSSPRPDDPSCRQAPGSASARPPRPGPAAAAGCAA